VPKVHNKPIKGPRKGFKQESKRQPERHPGLAHRTVRCATGQCPVHQGTRSQTRYLREFPRVLRYNSPDSVRCTLDCSVCQRSNGYFACNGRLQRIKCAPARAEVRGRAVGAPDSLQDLSGAPPDSLEAPQVRAPMVEPQRSADMAGAPDCSVRHATAHFQRPSFGGWGYKYPNHPTFNGIQVSTLLHLTRAIAFNTRHTKEIKSSPNSTQKL
jgi:hypothetical protein